MKNKIAYLLSALAISAFLVSLLFISKNEQEETQTTYEKSTYLPEVMKAAAGQWCANPGGLSGYWCRTGMSSSGCKSGCSLYNTVNVCGTPNWVANCEASCTLRAGCNAN